MNLTREEKSKNYKDIIKMKYVYEFHFTIPRNRRRGYTLIVGFDNEQQLNDYIDECFKDESEGKLNNWNKHIPLNEKKESS